MSNERKFRLSHEQRIFILAAASQAIDDCSYAVMFLDAGSKDRIEAENVIRIARSIQRGLG